MLSAATRRSSDDQWENGYEATLGSPLDIFSSGESGCPPANPVGTQIWGNGTSCDGVPPGFESDTLSHGDVILLLNTVDIPRDSNQIRFDGADKFGATYPVAVTRVAYPNQPGSALAGAVEVPRTAQWGTEYPGAAGREPAQRHERLGVFAPLHYGRQR